MKSGVVLYCFFSLGQLTQYYYVLTVDFYMHSLLLINLFISEFNYLYISECVDWVLFIH